MLEFLENTEYEVLTKDGFKDFKGVSTSKKECLRLTLENGEYIELTPDHKIIIDGKKIETKYFKIGDCVDYNNELVKIKNIEEVGIKNVCDLISVKDNNSFWCNNINISNCLLVDEAAFVPTHIWDDFYMSVYPTVSSGKKSKIIMVSTPNGMNLFYKIWTESVNGDNDYKNYKVLWREHPDRDEAWATEQERQLGTAKFNVEFNSISYETELCILINDTEVQMSIGDLYEDL